MSAELSSRKEKRRGERARKKERKITERGFNFRSISVPPLSPFSSLRTTSFSNHLLPLLLLLHPPSPPLCPSLFLSFVLLHPQRAGGAFTRTDTHTHRPTQKNTKNKRKKTEGGERKTGWGGLEKTKKKNVFRSTSNASTGHARGPQAKKCFNSSSRERTGESGRAFLHSSLSRRPYNSSCWYPLPFFFLRDTEPSSRKMARSSLKYTKYRKRKQKRNTDSRKPSSSHQRRQDRPRRCNEDNGGERTRAKTGIEEFRGD